MNFKYTLLGLIAVGVFSSSCTKNDKVDLPVEKKVPAAEVTAAPTQRPVAETAATPTQTPVAEAAAKTKASTNLRVSGQISSTHSGAASFKAAGHISKIIVQEGDRVKRGQILAQLDDEEARLKLRSAQEQLEQSQRNLRREEQLKRENATTEVSFENVNHANTLAQIALETAQKDLRDTKLLAPYDAVIAQKIKSEGEYVGVGVAVFDLAAINSLEVSLRVPEAMFRDVKVGQAIKITVPSINLQTKMKITRIVPVIDAASRTFTVIGKVNNNTSALMPGQFVEAQF